MINENQNQQIVEVVNAPTTDLVEELDHATTVTLSTGKILHLDSTYDLSWIEYSNYQDLGSNMKGSVGTNNEMLVDLSSTASASRNQKVYLIKLFWGAQDVDFKLLKVSDILRLWNPIKTINPLKGLAEAFKD
jgi:hypothetical protein